MNPERRTIKSGPRARDRTTMSHAEFVKEAYPTLSQDKVHTTKAGVPLPEVWQDYLAPILDEDVREAMRDTTKGTAAGVSQVMIDTIQHIDKANTHLITQLFNGFLQARRIPDDLNQ